MFVVALTGGIACGKSTVANLFQAQGIEVIDADRIARELVTPGMPAYQQILQHFGDNFKQNDGTLDRFKLKEIIFNQSQERLWLEKLLHPLIFERMLIEVQQAKSSYVIAAIPLLAEVGKQKYEKWVQRVLLVRTDEAVQKARLAKRDGLSEAFIQKILETQCSEKTRFLIADDIIQNNADITELAKKIKALHKSYLDLAAQSIENPNTTILRKKIMASNKKNSHIFFLENTDQVNRFACAFAEACKPPRIIFLSGPLGAGKTTWTQFFLKALGYNGKVRSPTFAIVETYPFTELSELKYFKGVCCHFDFYRLQEEEFSMLGFEDYLQKENLILIEWPENIKGLTVRPDLWLKFDYDEKGRIVEVQAHTVLGCAWLENLQRKLHA